MRLRSWLRVVAVLACLASATAESGLAGELPKWLQGCWAGSARGREFQERWVVADAGTMLGMSHTTKGGVLGEFEFLRIVAKAGKLTYVAQPGGAPPTEFAATAQSADEATFENPANDFPKRIVYRRTDAQHLVAWIDDGAGAKRIEFPMTRRACE